MSGVYSGLLGAILGLSISHALLLHDLKTQITQPCVAPAHVVAK